MTSRLCEVILVAGARPSFMKVAPIFEAMRWRNNPGLRPLGSMPHPPSPSSTLLTFVPTLVHTDQHYDATMSDVFFRELGLSEPDHHLGVGSGTHAEQTAAVMTAFEHVLPGPGPAEESGGAERNRRHPDLVVVVGDVNSTLGAALVRQAPHPASRTNSHYHGQILNYSELGRSLPSSALRQLHPRRGARLRQAARAGRPR